MIRTSGSKGNVTLLLATTLGVIGLVATACGGGSSGGTKAASGTPTTQASGVQAFIDCMASHGSPLSAAVIQRLKSPPTTDNGTGTPGAGGGFGGGGGAGTTRTTLDPAAASARQAATTACQSLAPANFRGGGFGGAGGTAARAFLASLRTWASCLSTHGYTKLLAALPAAPPAGQSPPSSQPPTSGGGPGGGQAAARQAFAAIDRTDPAFVTANQTCSAIEPKLPARGAAGGASTTTPTTTAG